MEGIGRYDSEIDIKTCPSSSSPHNIFNLKYSELPSSRYSYFLHGFKDENDFEEFKQDLCNFQKLKQSAYSGPGNSGGVNSSKTDYSDNQLTEDLEIIYRPNRTRRKTIDSQHLAGCDDRGETPSTSDTRTVEGSSELLSYPDTKSPRESPRVNRRSLGQRKFCLRPESFGLRADFDRRSGIYGYDRKSGLRSSINDLLMEFIDGDEHFQEFERVYETINDRRRSRDLNSLGRMSSSSSRTVSSPRLGSRDGKHLRNEPDNSVFVDDTFADFFNNDEDFIEFEKEFEKFRSNRLSRVFGSGSSFGSSRDIFGDLKAYCDRNVNKSNSGSLLSVSSWSSQGEAEPGCAADDDDNDDLIWRSEEDWQRMLKKMKRNSRLLSDRKKGGNRECKHRHSLYGLSSSSGVTDQYQKTQSLADLSLCNDEEPRDVSSKSTVSHSDSEQFNQQSRTHSTSDVMDRSCDNLKGSQNEGSSKDACCSRSRSYSRDVYDGDNSSVDAWSDSYGLYDDDIRYSSSSTLCSSQDNDLSFSLSCSCSSDLHIDEDTDEDLNYSSSPSSRQRSHSLMELSQRQRGDRRRGRYIEPAIHSGSLINLSSRPGSRLSQESFNNISNNNNNNAAGSSSTMSKSPSRELSPDAPFSYGQSSYSLKSSHDTDDIGTRHDYAAYSVSLGLSNDTADESDQYHSAKSDFSDHFHSAKSDLPSLCSSSRRREEMSGDDDGIHHHSLRSHSLSNVAENDSPRQRLSAASCSRVDEWLKDYGHNNNIPAGHCGVDDCHLTSHEHCVPLVNLNCITLPEDGGSPGSNLPSPSDPKASFETSLSLQTRPGCAKIVSNAATGEQPCRVSELAPELQEISRRQSLPDHHDHHLGQQSSVGSSSNPSTATSGYFSQGRHSSSPCLPGLPPPPSAIDELTQGNDDARFITTSHGQPQQHHHHHSPPPPSSHQQHHATQSSISNAQTTSPLPTTTTTPPIIEESSFTVTHSTLSQTVPAQTTPVNPASTTTLGVLEDTSQSLLSVKPDGEAGAEEKDETDSGYRSGTIPDEKLPKIPSQDTLDRQELKRKIAKYNHFVPAACLEKTGKDSFQGFIKVTMNLIRPITMELGARPPSIYELLTREHIIEENTQQVAFYMPRDTHKSLHITSETTTKDVVSSLLKKFHILDHPRKFAMYEQEFSDKNKLVRLRRLTDKNNPLVASLAWDPERIKNYRMVLQENETGEIVWEAFSLPELGNFLKVLEREEKETIQELRHKYAYMKQIMEKRLVEFKSGKHQVKKKTSNA